MSFQIRDTIRERGSESEGSGGGFYSFDLWPWKRISDVIERGGLGWKIWQHSEFSAKMHERFRNKKLA